DRKGAQALAGAGPGRGLTRDKLTFQAGMPRIDGDDDPVTLAVGVEHLVEEVTGAWTGENVPEVRLLPEVVKADELPSPNGAAPAGVAIGLSEADLEPVYL